MNEHEEIQAPIKHWITVEEHLSAETLAARLDVSVDVIHKWVREGKLKRVVMGRKCVRYAASDVNKFLKARKV